MTGTSGPGQPEPGGWLYLRALDHQDADMPPSPSPAATAEAVALLAGRNYRSANLGLSGDVEPADLIRALVNIACALLSELPEAEDFLQTLGADAAAARHAPGTGADGP